MTPAGASALAGAAAGIGVTLVVRGSRAAPPDLAATLARLDTRPTRSGSRPVGGHRGEFEATLGRWLVERLVRPVGGLRVPSADLRTVGRPVELFLARKALLTLLGLAVPTLAVSVLVVVGWSVPPPVPVAVGFVFGAAGCVLPDVRVRGDATRLRREFRGALGAYLDLVALERAADAGPADALSRAAEVGDGWAFGRIRAALTRARLAGVPPWQSLADLGVELDVGELADLADIVAIAGTDGAAIYDTLVQKAKSMRAAALATAKADANSASERMTVPTTILVFGFLLLAIYPSFARLH